MGDVSTIDLLTVARAAGLHLKLATKANRSGEEWSTGCPWCGGVNRLRFWPAPPSGRPHFWCRVCGTKGDGIELVKRLYGVDFHSALERLNMQTFTPRLPTATAKPRIVQVDDDPPSAAWQKAARQFIDACQDRLWRSVGQAALDYLRSRGLTDTTIRAWRLGYQAGDDWHEPAWWVSGMPHWGLPSLSSQLADWIDFRLPQPNVSGYDYSESDQPYHLELWIEKSTMDDVLLPICRQLGMNFVTSIGFQSITNAIKLLKRVHASGKPARVFYVSDFDPAGDGFLCV